MKPGSNSISEKLEDYILAVFRLTREHGHAHLGEVARLMGVKSSSANAALNSLHERGLISYEKYRPILLSDEGAELAVKMLERRRMLMSFFVETLGVEKNEARETVCKVEHIFEGEILHKLCRLVKGTEEAPKSGKKFLIHKLD